nr:MAG TPA_asm: hypothetical protein [Caudoviricetes sp.]
MVPTFVVCISCYEIRVIRKLTSLCRDCRKFSLQGILSYIYSRSIRC